MFKDNNRVDIAIALNLESYEVISRFHDYLKFSNLDSLVTTHQYLGDNLPSFLNFFDKMKEGILTEPAIWRFAR